MGYQEIYMNLSSFYHWILPRKKFSRSSRRQSAWSKPLSLFFAPPSKKNSISLILVTFSPESDLRSAVLICWKGRSSLARASMAEDSTPWTAGRTRSFRESARLARYPQKKSNSFRIFYEKKMLFLSKHAFTTMQHTYWFLLFIQFEGEYLNNLC